MNYVKTKKVASALGHVGLIYVLFSSNHSFASTDLVGGVEGIRAKPDQFPFMSLLSTRYTPPFPIYKSRGFCGATLIHPRYVLTARHCVEFTQAQGLSVEVGAYDLKADASELIPVKNITIFDSDNHEEYYDYAVLELERPSKAQPVDLMTKDEFFTIDSGELLTTMGWGLNEPIEVEFSDTSLYPYGRYDYPDHILNYIEIPYVDIETCRKAGGPYENLDKDAICAGPKEGGKGVCFSDNGGGPLLANTKAGLKQVGIVSWGVGCEQPERYGIYANIVYHLDYIRKLMHNISYTRSFYDVKHIDDKTYVQRFDYKNFRKDAVQFGSPKASDKGKIVKNTCPERLAQNQECFVDVEWVNKDSKRRISATLTMPVLSPNLTLVSDIQIEYGQEAPDYYKKALGHSASELLAYGQEWEIDEDNRTQGGSSLVSPKLKLGQESSIILNNVPSGILSFDYMMNKESSLVSLYVKINGVEWPSFCDEGSVNYFVNDNYPLMQKNNIVEIIYRPSGDNMTVWIDNLQLMTEQAGQSD